jgi:hypothetical protein
MSKFLSWCRNPNKRKRVTPSLHTQIYQICCVIFVAVFAVMTYSIIKHRKTVGHRETRVADGSCRGGRRRSRRHCNARDSSRGNTLRDRCRSCRRARRRRVPSKNRCTARARFLRETCVARVCVLNLEERLFVE